MRKNLSVGDLRKSYNIALKLDLSRDSNLKAPKSSKPTRKRKKNSVDAFKEKYANLSNTIDTFGTKEILYLFRQIAEDSGYKYVIANFKKDMGIMKRLRENYTNKEIWDMIDFLYNSEQDYLEKSKLSPNILVSGWCNTIYADSQLYIKGEYTNGFKKKSKRTSQLKNREWSNNKQTTSKVGEW